MGNLLYQRLHLLLVLNQNIEFVTSSLTSRLDLRVLNSFIIFSIICGILIKKEPLYRFGGSEELRKCNAIL